MGPIFTPMGPLSLPYTTPLAVAMTTDDIRELIAEVRSKATHGLIIGFEKKINDKISVLLYPKELARCRIYTDHFIYQEHLGGVWTTPTRVDYSDIKSIRKQSF